LSARTLAIIALSTGRAKDFTRILALLEASCVTTEQLAGSPVAWFERCMEPLHIEVSEMSEVIKLLERQSAWQKSRKELSWPEKNSDGRSHSGFSLAVARSG